MPGDPRVVLRSAHKCVLNCKQVIEPLLTMWVDLWLDRLVCYCFGFVSG